METTLAVATVLIALGGFGLGIRSYFRDKTRDEETRRVEVERHAFERKMAEQSAAIQQRLADIEEVRHRRELDAVATADAEREEAEQRRRTAGLVVQFNYRDSKHSWARIAATNHGPADATGVTLGVYGEIDGDRVEINEIANEDYGTTDRLQTNESVHVSTSFTMGSPQPADLRYHLSWTDGRGRRNISGQVPVG